MRNSRCDVVHAHEWGGVFADVVTANHFRQLTPGLRIAIEPHGGHVWSQLGEMNRPMDVGGWLISSSSPACTRHDFYMHHSLSASNLTPDMD